VKVSFDLEKTLHDLVLKNGKKNGRSVSAEIRFQLKIVYGVKN